jgi:predicted cobalt transporter CbtA
MPGRHAMKINMPAVLYVAAMVAVIVGVDVLFFRNRLWERLLVNIGIVLVFLAFYLRYMRGS